MPKFRVNVIETCYGFVDVEAASKEEAIQEAYSLNDTYYVNKSDVKVLKDQVEEIPLNS